MSVYAEKDYVEVVDADGNVLAELVAPVPKAWVGTDLLPPGAKAKRAARGGSSAAAKTDPDASTAADDDDQSQQGDPS